MTAHMLAAIIRLSSDRAAGWIVGAEAHLGQQKLLSSAGVKSAFWTVNSSGLTQLKRMVK